MSKMKRPPSNDPLLLGPEHFNARCTPMLPLYGNSAAVLFVSLVHIASDADEIAEQHIRQLNFVRACFLRTCSPKGHGHWVGHDLNSMAPW